MAKHTPGPWLHRGKSDGVYTAPPAGTAYSYGTVIFGFNEELAPSDADLAVILASPDMLAALYEVETYLAEREDVVDGDYGQPAPNKEMTLLREVREAIYKATGEKV